MSFPNRLRLTAQSSIKCPTVRYETHSTIGVRLDIIGNDLKLLRDRESDFVLLQDLNSPILGNTNIVVV